jgi:hypothetical protein
MGDVHTEALDGITLTSGSHERRDEGLCAMEAVAFLAGEPHSDAPACACPILGAFARRLNDARWPTDADRTEAMRPAVLALVGSRSAKATERARRAYLVDCALRWYAPMALMAAVGACESHGIDCAALRAAALRLCEEPTRDHALLARDEARSAYAAAYAAAAAAYAAADAAAAAAADDAAAAAADARLVILRLAAEHLVAACAITAEAAQ